MVVNVHVTVGGISRWNKNNNKHEAMMKQKQKTITNKHEATIKHKQ